MELCRARIAVCFVALWNLLVCYRLSDVCWGQDRGAVDYERDIAPIFRLYCASCHNEKDQEGGLVLESYATLLRGGKHGPVISPGQPASSRLWLMVSGKLEPKMPPDNAEGPPPAKLALLAAWIEAGARGPGGTEPDRRTLITPRLPAAPQGAKVLTALALSPDGRRLALGRFGCLEVVDTQSGELLWRGEPLAGRVTRLRFSRDGTRLVAASGVAGLYGEATLWATDSGQKLASFTGHYDTLYDAVLAPGGTLLATSSYDKKILLWDVSSGKPLRTLEGHNGAVYALAFSADGRTLASASADETVKLWRVEDGLRLDTLSQPDREQYAVLFDPQQRYIYAAGADNRIRLWQYISRQEPQINPIVDARYAHEGTILFLDSTHDGTLLASAASDGTIKVWDTEPLRERYSFAPQSDLITGIALAPHGEKLYVAHYQGDYSVLEIPGPTPSSTLARGQAAPPPVMDSLTMKEAREEEPNDSPQTAMRIDIPVTVRGTIHNTTGISASDVDVFRFTARKGQEWVVEVVAARNGSPLDSYVEILRPDGSRIPRVILQAVRNSYFTFRGKDSDTSDDFRLYNWEEMELNEYLYAQGEVVKLWLYPRGPDSGFKVYPGFGKRHTYFDTPALAHALGEPCYIVRPYEPGSTLVPNGLPVFTVYYENDDDRLRQLGADSRLFFTVPEDGEYLVRLSDVRGFQGPAYEYQLKVRPRRPDFQVRLQGQNPTIGQGSAWEFTLLAERHDDFEGAIRIDISGMPSGLHVTSPLWIEEEQWTAAGVIYAEPDAQSPPEEALKEIRLVASAEIDGQTITKEVVGSFGTIRVGPKPKIIARILPWEKSLELTEDQAEWKPYEFWIQPGQTIRARVRIERNGFQDRVPFGNEDSGRNLPHGVFVDNIGLNGLLIVEGSDEREFFITAAKWVPEQTRTFHLRARVEGEQATWPAVLHVRRSQAP